MTTEIAVLNRLGIALATDSAVTISSGDSSKVFNSADKLFELTRAFPVAVMVNGNMDCVGVPWEILIKDFREHEGARQRNSIGEWAADLLKFAQDRSHAIEETNEDVLSGFAIQEVEFIKNEILSKYWRNLGSDNISGTIRLVSEQRTAFLVESGLSEAHSDLSVNGLAEQYHDLLADLIINELDPVQVQDEVVGIIIVQIISASLSMWPPDILTGVIVAGYGNTEEFPCVSSFDLAGASFGRLKVSSIRQRAVVSNDKRGHVVSFAQNDVIERLLGGADPLFTSKAAKVVEGMFTRLTDALSEIGMKKRLSSGERRARAAAITEMAAATAEEFLQAAKQMQDDFKINFERMIAMMPKIELIEFAEALISITAIERKATTDQGTVGGPIDVAFVSKHEGFVWIKRKLYFPGALNPRYFWRKFGYYKPES